MTDDLTTVRSMAATIARLSDERDAMQARLAGARECIGGLLQHLDALNPGMHTYGMTPDWFIEAARIVCHEDQLAPAQAGVGGWQDIASAPKDGRWIMVVCDWGDHANDWLRVVRWDRRRDGFGWATMDPDGMAHGGNIGDNVPTHWMPLPAPPASGDKP